MFSAIHFLNSTFTHNFLCHIHFLLRYVNLHRFSLINHWLPDYRVHHLMTFKQILHSELAPTSPFAIPSFSVSSPTMEKWEQAVAVVFINYHNSFNNVRWNTENRFIQNLGRKKKTILLIRLVHQRQMNQCKQSAFIYQNSPKNWTNLLSYIFPARSFLKSSWVNPFTFKMLKFGSKKLEEIVPKPYSQRQLNSAQKSIHTNCCSLNSGPPKYMSTWDLRM